MIAITARRAGNLVPAEVAVTSAEGEQRLPELVERPLSERFLDRWEPRNLLVESNPRYDDAHDRDPPWTRAATISFAAAF